MNHSKDMKKLLREIGLVEYDRTDLEKFGLGLKQRCPNCKTGLYEMSISRHIVAMHKLFGFVGVEQPGIARQGPDKYWPYAIFKCGVCDRKFSSYISATCWDIGIFYAKVKSYIKNYNSCHAK